MYNISMENKTVTRKQIAFASLSAISDWGRQNASGDFSALFLTRDVKYPTQPVTIQYREPAVLDDQDERFGVGY